MLDAMVTRGLRELVGTYASAVSGFIANNVIGQAPEVLSSCEWCDAPNAQRSIGCKNMGTSASFSCARSKAPIGLKGAIG